ncbi:hypothetical protein EAE96_008469 [Botrytis aclada]|nr:hypothetical protein EAE96_008469 [Botrytis aclada]
MTQFQRRTQCDTYLCNKIMNDICDSSGFTQTEPYNSTSEQTNEIAKNSKRAEFALQKNRALSNELFDKYDHSNDKEILKDDLMDPITPEKNSHDRKERDLI